MVDPDHNFSSRIATPDDIPALAEVMNGAIGKLQAGFLSEAQIEASREVMGMDTQLIDDRTYFVIEAHRIEMKRVAVGCGGWSRRATLYGGDHSKGRSARLLDPACEAARIRAMYTHPAWARRGIGKLILGLCEAAATEAGYRRAEMMATLSGEPLYRACGYRPIEHIEDETSGGIKVPLIRMGKDLW